MKNTQQGFFLQKHNFSESSSVVSFYTADQGLQKWVFKGGRKKTALNPFGFYELAINKRPEAELGYLQSASLIEAHLNTRNSPPKLLLSFFICDVVKQSVHEGVPDVSMFNVLKEFSKELNQTQDLILFPIHFLIQWLILLGIAPFPLANAKAIDPENGVFIIDASTSQHWTIGASTWNAYLNGIFDMDKKAAKDMLSLILKYISFHIPNFNTNKTTEIIHQTIYD